MAQGSVLTPDDRKFLAGLVHQVWRGCQVFVALEMERGPQQAHHVLEELAQWAATQRSRLNPRAVHRPRLVSPPAMRVGRQLLDDVDTICRRISEILGGLERSSLTPEQVEEQALGIIEGVVTWTSLMASQLGITRNLRPQMLWFHR